MIISEHKTSSSCYGLRFDYGLERMILSMHTCTTLIIQDFILKKQKMRTEVLKLAEKHFMDNSN